jgi:uncharacterized protein (TIGR02271 family)
MSDYNTNAGAGAAYGSESMLSALFDSYADAERAVERLREAGIPESSIRLTRGYEADRAASAEVVEDRPKGFLEGLGDFFFPDEDRHLYAEGLSRGGYLVTVDGLSGAMQERALDILDDEGVVNLEEREAAWRAEGWSGYGQSTTNPDVGSDESAFRREASGFSETGTPEATGRTYAEDETVPVVEERLRIGKRDVSHGRVRVRSYVREEPVSEDVELVRERVEVERRPVDRPVAAGEDAFRERTIEAEERREEAVVTKEARVVEEIGLRRTQETERETVSDTVRRTEVVVEEDEDDKLDRR